MLKANTNARPNANAKSHYCGTANAKKLMLMLEIVLKRYCGTGPGIQIKTQRAHLLQKICCMYYILEILFT